jgi:hypothetical protein
MLITYRRKSHLMVQFSKYIFIKAFTIIRINHMSEEIKKDNYSADSIQALEWSM